MDRCSGDRTSRRRGARYMNDRKRWTFVHAALQKFRWRFFGHCNSQNCHGQERTAEKSTGHGTGVRASDVFNGSGCFFLLPRRLNLQNFSTVRGLGARRIFSQTNNFYPVRVKFGPFASSENKFQAHNTRSELATTTVFTAFCLVIVAHKA
jgi:hypothetical protein